MVKKIVLAYSGGLDTSVILKWLQLKYNCPVATFTADLGQGDELEPIRDKAESLGVKEIFIENLQEEFVKNYVFPMFRANTLYEGTYLLGTGHSRSFLEILECLRAITEKNLKVPIGLNVEHIMSYNFQSSVEMLQELARIYREFCIKSKQYA